MRIGAQFYTLRDFCKTLDDFSLSLKRVAEIGYEYVQISGTCSFEPEWLKSELDKNGLKCVLTHTPPDKLAKAEETSAEHDIFGCKYIGLGHNGFNIEENPNAVSDFKNTYIPIGNALKKCGKYFMYHNHDGEFQKINGKTILAHLADEISADCMGFTLDTFWVQAGGGDPADWIKRLSGRVPCIHLKDFAYGKKMAVIGEGNINFDRVFLECESAGTEYMLVEQDDCNGENPFDCLKKSFGNLKAMGFK